MWLKRYSFVLVRKIAYSHFQHNCKSIQSSYHLTMLPRSAGILFTAAKSFRFLKWHPKTSVTLSVHVKRMSSVQRSKEKVLLDVDTGIDDAQAIMMALSCPHFDVLGITCVNGNVDVDTVCLNTCRTLEACDKMEVPVYKGATVGLMGAYDDVETYEDYDGLGNVKWDKAPPMDQVQEEHAVSALLRLTKEYPGEITLIALAPLTNLALALRMDGEFGKRLKRVICMGGNIEAKGRMTPCAEFNFYMDPEAAYIVLQEIGCDFTLIPYEIGGKAGIPWDWHDKYLTGNNTKKEKFHTAINESTSKARKEKYKTKDYVSRDPCAMAVAMDSSVVCQSVNTFCTVELQGKLTRAQMVVDWHGLLKKTPNVEIVTDIEVSKLQKFYIDMLK